MGLRLRDQKNLISTAQMGITFTLSGAVTAPRPTITERRSLHVGLVCCRTTLDLVCINQGR